jgi:hypothetical protein
MFVSGGLQYNETMTDWKIGSYSTNILLYTFVNTYYDLCYGWLTMEFT